MKERALTTAVFFPLWEMTKRALSGRICLEGLSKAVIHCERRTLDHYLDSIQRLCSIVIHFSAFWIMNFEGNVESGQVI